MSNRRRRRAGHRHIPPGGPQVHVSLWPAGVKGLPEAERSEPLTPDGHGVVVDEGASGPQHDCVWCAMAGIRVLDDGSIVPR